MFPISTIDRFRELVSAAATKSNRCPEWVAWAVHCFDCGACRGDSRGREKELAGRMNELAPGLVEADPPGRLRPVSGYRKENAPSPALGASLSMVSTMAMDGRWYVPGVVIDRLRKNMSPIAKIIQQMSKQGLFRLELAHLHQFES